LVLVAIFVDFRNLSFLFPSAEKKPSEKNNNKDEIETQWEEEKRGKTEKCEKRCF
jgi:hypothetical protein